jgi:hypothetical protein
MVNAYLPARVGDLATSLTDCIEGENISNTNRRKQTTRQTKRIEGTQTVQTDDFSHFVEFD